MSGDILTRSELNSTSWSLHWVLIHEVMIHEVIIHEVMIHEVVIHDVKLWFDVWPFRNVFQLLFIDLKLRNEAFVQDVCWFLDEIWHSDNKDKKNIMRIPQILRLYSHHISHRFPPNNTILRTLFLKCDRYFWQVMTWFLKYRDLFLIHRAALILCYMLKMMWMF